MFLTIKITFRFEACTYIKKVLKTGQVFRTSQCFASRSGTPSGIRTLDPLIKSQLLYQLS